MRVLAALLVSSPLLAQAVSLGLRAGVPITPALITDARRQAPTSRYTIGPLIEVHLWRGVGFGADFLLHHAGLALSPQGSPRAGIWRWELPMTLIYRFRAPVQPFVRAGVSLNRVFDISGATECARGPSGERFYCLEGLPLAELRHRGTSGPVIGGGLRFKLKNLRLDPELRLTRWIDRNVGVRDSPVRSNLTQIGFLLGLVF